MCRSITIFFFAVALGQSVFADYVQIVARAKPAGGMYGRIANLFLAAAALSSAGCSEFMAGYNDAKAHRGESGYSFAERLARVGDAVANDAGRFATGYANASADYAYMHPAPVYVQPVYIPQYQYQPMPQHGTMTVTPNTIPALPTNSLQPFGFAPSYNINY